MTTNKVTTQLDIAAKKIVTAGMAKFREHVGNSVKQILLAAQQYATDIENYPKLASAMYREAFPNVSERSWELLRKIGVGDLVPTAFFSERDASVNMLAKCPYKLQQTLLGDVDRSAVPQNLWDGKKVVSKRFSDMSYAETLKLLNTTDGKIRTVEEQKKYQPVKVVCDTVAPAEAPYTICGRVVIFRRHCEIGEKELLAIVRKLGLNAGRERR